MTGRTWPLFLAAAVTLIAGGVRAAMTDTTSDTIAAVLLAVGLVLLGVWIATELRQ